MLTAAGLTLCFHLDNCFNQILLGEQCYINKLPPFCLERSSRHSLGKTFIVTAQPEPQWVGQVVEFGLCTVLHSTVILLLG